MKRKSSRYTAEQIAYALRQAEHLRRIPNRRDIQSPGCLHREDGGRIEVTQNMESRKTPLAPR